MCAYAYTITHVASRPSLTDIYDSGTLSPYATFTDTRLANVDPADRLQLLDVGFCVEERMSVVGSGTSQEGQVRSPFLVLLTASGIRVRATKIENVLISERGVIADLWSSVRNLVVTGVHGNLHAPLLDTSLTISQNCRGHANNICVMLFSQLPHLLESVFVLRLLVTCVRPTVRTDYVMNSTQE